MISLVVVINGPVANAGSNLYLININGMKRQKSTADGNSASNEPTIMKAR